MVKVVFEHALLLTFCPYVLFDAGTKSCPGPYLQKELSMKV